MSLPIYSDHQTPSAQFCQWLMGVTGEYDRPGDYHTLGLTGIQFLHPKVTPRIYSNVVTVQGLATITRAPGDSTTAIKVEFVRITN